MDMKTFLLVLALTASPIYALSIEPSTFSAVLYPGENVTFSFNTTGSDMIYTSAGDNLSCAFSNGQKIKFVSGTITDNVTIKVNGDAGTGTYRCDITAQATVPDPQSSSQGTSGGGSGLYISTDLQQKLMNGSYIAVPKDIVIPAAIKETKTIILEKNITNQPIINIINRSLASSYMPTDEDTTDKFWMPFMIVVVVLGSATLYLVIKITENKKDAMSA